MVSKDVLQKGTSTSSMTHLHLPRITDNCHWVLSRSIASSSVVSTLERERAAKVPIQGVVRLTAPAGVALNWTKEAEKSCWAAFLPLGIVIWLPQMRAKKSALVMLAGHGMFYCLWKIMKRVIFGAATSC